MSKKFFQDLTSGKVDCFHAAEIVHYLHQQWLNREYCDLKIVVENHEYYVHKCVVACFSALFCDEVNKLNTITLDVTKYGFEKVLEFMYKGKMSKLASMDLKEFQEIMKAADALNSAKVVKYCIQERSDLVQSLNKNRKLDSLPDKEDSNTSDERTAAAHVTGNDLPQSSSKEDNVIASAIHSSPLNLGEESASMRKVEGPIPESPRSLLQGDGEMSKDLRSGERQRSPLNMTPRPSDLNRQTTNFSLTAILNGMHKKFQCSLCEQAFVCDTVLQQHMEKHRQKQYSCNTCGKTFRFQIAFLSHLKEHMPGIRNCVTCKICGRGFKFNSSLKHHNERCHPQVFKKPKYLKLPRKNVAPAKAARKIVGVDLSLLTDMLSEMKPTDGKYTCPLCDRDFSRKWNLRYHMLKHYEEKAKRPKFISDSAKTPAQSTSLKIGAGSSCHAPGSAHESYVSTTKPVALLTKKRARRSSEPTEISHWCDLCGKGFKRQRNLQGHMETHTGCGFQCPICGRAFSQKDGLHGHLWVHGGYTGTKDIVGKRRSLAERSNAVKIEGASVVLGPDDHDENSLDLTSQETIPDDLSDGDVSVNENNSGDSCNVVTPVVESEK